MNTQKNPYPKLTQAINQVGTKFPEILSGMYGHVMQQIELTWGSKDAVRYLDSLLLQDSEEHEDRQEFPLEAIREIVLVKQTHDYLFPLLDNSPFDPFSAAQSILPPPQAPVPDTANLLEFGSQPARDSNLDHNAPGSLETVPAATASQTSDMDAQATEKPTKNRVNWPKVHTQHKLLEYAELQNRSDTHIYEQQGKLVGAILTHYKLIDERNMNLVAHIQRRVQYQDKAIGQILVEIGIISNEELFCALCIQAGIIMVDVLTIPINSKTVKPFPSEQHTPNRFCQL